MAYHAIYSPSGSSSNYNMESKLLLLFAFAM